jgi:hypothetical protein
MSHTAPYRTTAQWILTHHGRDHYLNGPEAYHPDNVPSPREIAWSLAHLNRFTGHTNRPYSVAEHSLLVMNIARLQFQADAGGQLAALMHDAHECIVGDVASPIKQVINQIEVNGVPCNAWHKFETSVEQHLRYHLGLTELYQQHHAMVKQCDLIALATERRDLMLYDPAHNLPWSVIDTHGNRAYPFGMAGDLDLSPRINTTPAQWAALFDRHYIDLSERVRSAQRELAA